jgi:hypothetical protein
MMPLRVTMADEQVIAARVVMAGQKARSAVFAPDVPAIHVFFL